MVTLKLVRVEWHSNEREKYIWQDLYQSSWDEIIGRVYLLKAHAFIEDENYEIALTAFQQALKLLPQNDSSQHYYYCALADKAITECFLEHYDVGLSDIHQALATTEISERDLILNDLCSILVLAGKFSEALDLLQAQLAQSPQDPDLRFTLATCLLHLERYTEAITAYEQAITKSNSLNDAGLKAARRAQQPDWAHL